MPSQECRVGGRADGNVHDFGLGQFACAAGLRGDVVAASDGLLQQAGPATALPIIAFAPYAAGKDGGSSAREAYDKGTAALLETFSAGPAADGERSDAEPPDPEALLLFAAMISARVLGEAAGDVPWVGAVRKAVVEAVAKS